MDPTPISPTRGAPANKKITEEVIDIAGFALARRFKPGEIKLLLKTKYKLSPRSCMTVLKKARERIIDISGKSAEDHRSEAYQFYDSVLRDADASVRERLLAQERIDKLFGLEGEIKVKVNSGVQPHDIVKKLSETPEGRRLLEKLDDEVAQLREAK